MRGGGGTGNFFSYGERPTKEGFRLFRSFLAQTPDFVFIYLLPFIMGVTKSIEEAGAEWRRSSSMQLELAFINGTSSMLQCLTVQF